MTSEITWIKKKEIAEPIRTIGWAIVGTGWFAGSFIAPALNKTKGVKLVAVHSRDKERAATFAAKHNIENSYDSYAEMLSNPEVEVVHIITPNNLHAEQTIQAAEMGKHVFCEKAMALTMEDCERMIEACRKNRVKLGVGFQNRHHPGHVEARRLISSGELGEIFLVTSLVSLPYFDFTLTGWRADPEMAGGGSIMAGGVHVIDLLRFMLGKEVEEVQALSDAKWLGSSTEDTMLVNLKYENGPFGSIISSLNVPRAYGDFVIYGTKARINGVGTIGRPPTNSELQLVADNISEKIGYSFDPILDKYIYQAEAFNRCIEEDTEPNASGEDGLEVVRLTLAILESAKKQKSVRIVR